ncbi:MAG: alpha/beta hydrolase [Ferruginibacter sp.]
MIEKHISIDNINIYYKVAGSGKAVMLIHGFAESSSIWSNQVAFLNDRFLIITPDLPGTGKSGLLQNENPGMEDYAYCLHLILRQENITKCIMIGHSMGGYISLAFAEKYPAQLLALGLFHSSAFADDDEKIDKRKKAILFIKENGAESFLKTSIPGLFYDVEKNDPYIAQLLQAGQSFTGTALINYYSAMINRPDRTSVLKTFTHPVLFILGIHDQAVPYEAGLKQTYLPQQAYIYVLRNSAHMGMLEETPKSNQSLLAFLQNI